MMSCSSRIELALYTSATSAGSYLLSTHFERRCAYDAESGIVDECALVLGSLALGMNDSLET